MNMTGWICPTCGRTYSPYVSTCEYCNETYDNGMDKIISKGALPQKEEIVVESKPNIDLTSIIAPIREEIIDLRRDLPLDITDKSIRDRQEGYNLAIDDVLELIDSETTDKTVVIEITNPFCKGNCETCTMNCKRRG